MAIISIATEWASDLKQGHCSAGWWLNRKFCCWELMDKGGSSPPAAVKATIAAAAAAAAASPSPASNVTTSLARGLAWSFPREAVGPAASALEYASALYPRAATSSSDPGETCADWIPWTTWAFPAWIMYIIFAAALAAACAHLVRAFAPYAAGSGITEIKCILAGFIINGFLGFQTLAIKSLTLPLAIASGLSIGKEGPAVHVACCIGNVVAGFFKSFDRSQARMRELLTASSAAGVAVAFGSPIGGVLFSLEEMAHQFPATTMWRSFLCALAATVALSFMNPFRTGKLVLFQVSYDRDWHYFEMIFYIIIGIFGGLYGAFVIKYNLQVQAFRRNNLAAYGVSEAVVLATLTALVGYWNKFLRIDMSESLEILFRECEGGGDYDNLCQSWAQWQMINSLLLATVLRTVLVVLSYGCKVPAGIFVPSMAIGATFGRMLGILVKALYTAFPNAAIFSACQPDVPCITPGTYAFLGAAAALAGVTRITAAVVVIMFELTGALTYILPTMIVVMVTKGVGDYYGKGGIAEQTMKFAGYPFLDKDEYNFGLLPVGEVMKRDPDMVFADGTALKDVEERLNNTYRGFPVVRSQSDRTLLGYVGKTELRFAINKAKRARSSLGGDVKCYFTCEETGTGSAGIGRSEPPPTAGTLIDDEEEEDKLATSNRDGDREGLMSDTARGRSSMTSLGDSDQEDDHYGDLGGVNGGVDGEGEEDLLELGEWVDQTPLTVGPNMPLEVVMDLFKKMGPRVILITDRQGAMQGLVTVKDLLKHIAAQEHADALARRAAREALDAQGGLPEWVIAGDTSGEADGNVINNFNGELERSLSEAWSWAKQRMAVWREGGSARHSSRRTGPEYAELHERGQSQEGGAAEVLYDGEGEEEGYGDLEGADDGDPSSAYATAQPRSQFGTPVTPTSTRARNESDQFVIE